MPHLLHIDSSITGEQSTSRRLSARAARRWLAAHQGGTITFRDLAAHPIPHFDAVTGLARMVPPEKRTRAEQLSFALSVELINEIKLADTVVLGLPLYNYGPPSTIKAWVDHLIAPGVSVDAQTNAGLLGDTEFIVLAARGGGYGPGTPREGWDHAEPWLRHALSTTGLEPRFITAELTVASSNPAMADHRQPMVGPPVRRVRVAAADRSPYETCWSGASFRKPNRLSRNQSKEKSHESFR